MGSWVIGDCKPLGWVLNALTGNNPFTWHSMKKVKEDPYLHKPWKNQDEYHKLAELHHLFGADLEEELKRLDKLKIPIPNIKPPRSFNS